MNKLVGSGSTTAATAKAAAIIASVTARRRAKAGDKRAEGQYDSRAKDQPNDPRDSHNGNGRG